MPDREKVMRGLMHHSGEEIPIPCDNCPYDDDEPYCSQRLAADALALLREQEPMVLKYSEIAEHPLVWVEDIYTKDVIPALFTQYDGCGAHFAIQVRDKYNDSIVRSTISIHSETAYGKIWRCWTSSPTEEQRKKVAWKPPKEEGNEKP